MLCFEAKKKRIPRDPDIYGKWISCSFFCFFLMKGGFIKLSYTIALSKTIREHPVYYIVYVSPLS